MYQREKALLEQSGVSVIAFEKHNDHIDDAGIGDKVRIAKNCIHSGKAKSELIELIKKEMPDVAHFHNTFPQMSLSVYEACYELGVPIVQTLHNFRQVCSNALFLRDGKNCELCITGGTVSVWPGIKNKCYRGSMLATLPLALQIKYNHIRDKQSLVSQYISLTNFAKQKFVSAGYAEHKISIKPNFVSDLGFSATPKDYFLYVGRLSDEKGVSTLIEAWRKLPKHKLIVLGDGELRPSLEKIAVNKNLNIEFKGQVSHDQVKEYMGNAKALIIPSICYEGFPAVIAEAYSCGTPVISSNIGSLKELVVKAITGFKFEPGNQASLAKAVEDFDVNANQSLLRATARETYSNRFAPQNNLAALLEIYERAIRQRRLDHKLITSLAT